MSYSVNRTSEARNASGVTVGAVAFSDPVLAKASLDASTIMLAMAKAPPAQRLAVMTRELDRRGIGLARAAGAEMKAQLVRGAKPDQAAFDAMRVALANSRMASSLERVRMDIASKYGWDSMLDSGLGQIAPNDRAAGCIAAGTGTAVGGALQIIPVYGTIIGGIMGIAGGIAGQALDCGREERESAARLAAAQAAQAQAQLAAAAAEATRRSQRIRKLAIGGGVLVAVLATTWIVLK